MRQYPHFKFILSLSSKTDTEFVVWFSVDSRWYRRFLSRCWPNL